MNMERIIYRGFDITVYDRADQNGNSATINQHGKELARVKNEADAYKWIDAEKRKQSAGK